MPVVPLMLWELPSMILMSLHKLWCAATGGSLQRSFRRVWFYRIVGMFSVWTLVLVLIDLAQAGGAWVGLFSGVLPVAVLGIPALLLWARFSSKGA